MIAEFTTALETSFGSNEAELVSAAQKGDLEAFNRLVISYQEKVFNLALRILGDEASAEDITQTTFLAAFRSLRRFRNGSFRSWLYRIATNACYDEYRRLKRHPVLSSESEDVAEEKFTPLDGMPGLNILPEKEYDRHERDLVVQQALDRLETEQRSVVVLVDLQDLDYQEAAQILGVPVGTVKSRLARARIKLGQLLSPKLAVLTC
jgi:RNA polymerase sigma-70 factor (ECF subfamily)